jgi:HAD superfamily hydrolase (TIGR01549 family)
MTAPEAILFDFGGTLDADGVAWKERFAALVRAEAPALAGEGFDRAFYAADDALVGTIPADLSFRETVERLAAGLARELDAPPELATRVAARFLADSLERLAGSAALLDRLSPRYRLGIVSNFYGNLGAVCASTGIARHLGAAIDSAAVGFEKPDPRIFQAALDALAVSADRAVFVGDSLPRDMAGARAMGMRHVYLKPGADAACCPDDAVIARLDRLPGVLP